MKINYQFLILLICSITVNATNYYVDKTNGLDNNSGVSVNQAWKSLSNIYTKRTTFVAGDTIFLKGGEVWDEYLNLTLNGSPSASIVVAGYGVGRPCIKGIPNALQAVGVMNCSYVEVRDIEIDGSNLATQNVAGLRLGASLGKTLRKNTIRNLYIHDVKGTHVKADGGGSGIFIKRGASKSLFDSLLIENNLIRNCTRNGIIFGTDYSGRSNWQPNLNVVIRGNVLEQVPGDGIVVTACNKALVEYNIMRDCTPLLSGESAAGIWPWGADSTIIQYNEVSGHRATWDGQGFDSDYNCKGTIIQYNYSHDNDGGFLLVCCDGSSLGKDWNAGNTGTIVRFNVSINDGVRKEASSSGMFFSPFSHVAGPTENTYIYNNLLYETKKTAPYIDYSMIRFGDWGGYPKNTNFWNNIFYVENDAVTEYFLSGLISTTFSNNLYYGTQVGKPFDLGRVNSDPKFEGSIPSTKEERNGFDFLSCFRLSGTSPAINKGLLIPNTDKVHDFFGKYLPLGSNPSIGIHYPNGITKLSNTILEPIAIYPNPVIKSAVASFELSNASPAIITIHNSNGSVVYKKIANCQSGLQRINLDMDNLCAGNYILCIMVDNKNYITKIIKK